MMMNAVLVGAQRDRSPSALSTLGMRHRRVGRECRRRSPVDLLFPRSVQQRASGVITACQARRMPSEDQPSAVSVHHCAAARPVICPHAIQRTRRRCQRPSRSTGQSPINNMMKRCSDDMSQMTARFADAMPPTESKQSALKSV